MRSAGRRREGRLRLDIDAQLIDLQRTQQVRLVDLSARGAKVQAGIAPRIGGQAFVRWHGQEAFGTIAWTRGGFCGITFDRALSHDELVRLRDNAPPSARQASAAQARQAARDWSQGWDETQPTGPSGSGRRIC